MTENVRNTISQEFPDFVITEELNNIITTITDSRENLFITGPAGCGKSTLLNLINNKKIYDKNTVVLAPTGVSAVNVSGMTIHSFFKFKIGLFTEDELIKKRVDDDQLELLEKLDTIIIDEISMVNANMFDSIDIFLRYHLNSDIPFGGKRIILFGDLFQLPPVITKASNEKKAIENMYGENNYYFFHSFVYEKANIKVFLLEKVFRQDNIDFVNLLHRIRKGKQTSMDIRKINCYVKNEEKFLDTHDDYVYIAYTNSIVNQKNQDYLDIIPSESKTYTGSYFGKINLKDFITPLQLELKVGAQVMVTANNHNEGYFNGMIGEVVELQDDKIIIISKGNRYTITQYTWEKIEYKIINKSFEKSVVGKYKQFPLKLAFAITAHKCQGLTLDSIYIDTGNGSFSTGQFYVSISRLRTFEGLGLSKPISAKEVKVDQSVIEYFEKLGI